MATTVQDRVMAMCEQCESAYAARIIESGRIQPIGRDVCSCGSNEFRVLE